MVSLLRIVVRVFVALLVVALLVGGASMIASESGEVVVLKTTDPTGAARETRVWVVEDGSHVWLRSGSDAAGWYQQLAARPDVEVQRGDQTLRVRAVPEVGARARINGLMREKYGWADAYIGMLFGRDDAIPIRLDPR